MRPILGAMALLLLFSGSASAEWQIKPFVGFTFGGDTTFVDFEDAAGSFNFGIFGVGTVWLGEVFGVEADFARAPGFFQSGQDNLVGSNAVTTLTGNVVAAVPRRVAQYSLRPYLVGGMGMMRIRVADTVEALAVRETLTSYDVGGGVTGFLSQRFGLSWDVRRFGTIGGETTGASVTGPAQLSFWRVNMALAIRY